MNILESHRVLSALDATVDSLRQALVLFTALTSNLPGLVQHCRSSCCCCRLLSYITLEVVAAADQLGGVLGQVCCMISSRLSAVICAIDWSRNSMRSITSRSCCQLLCQPYPADITAFRSQWYCLFSPSSKLVLAL